MARLRQIRSQVQSLGPAIKMLQRRAPTGSWQRDNVEEAAFRKTARWQRLRWSVLERDEFTCQWPGCGVVMVDSSKLVADHIVPVRVDPSRKWDMTNLQCLCEACHSGPKQALEVALYGPGGAATGGGV